MKMSRAQVVQEPLVLYETELDTFKRRRNSYFDFKTTPASMGVYGLHQYPAMLHFMVVRELLLKYSKKNDLIFDPFAGSGVVATECLLNERNFIGCDINPLAIMIAKARTTPIHSKKLNDYKEIIEKRFRKIKPSKVDFHNIDFWFFPETIKDLSRLKKAIFEIENSKIKNFFKVVFSDVVRKVSHTRNNEFKLFRNKELLSINVLDTFLITTSKFIHALEKLNHAKPEKSPSVQIYERNILANDFIEDNSIDLIITSPPYGDSKTTVAYGQFSRLSLRWLDIEEIVDKTSLGAKPQVIEENLPSEILYEKLELVKQQDLFRATEVFSFYKDLLSAIEVISTKVKKGGTICFVVGNRRVKGFELPTDLISADFFSANGFHHKETIVRAISSKRMPTENSPTNIAGVKDTTMSHEYIVILKKEL